MSRSIAFLLLGCALFGPSAALSQVTYASTFELKDELGRRKADLARAEERLATLGVELAEARSQVDAARVDSAASEANAAKRVAVLYRLTRQGALLRYLLGSRSPVELLRRLGFLRALSVSGLEQRRQAGLRLAQAEDHLASVAKRQEETGQLVAELQQTIAEIETELGQTGVAATGQRTSKRQPSTAKVEPVDWSF